VTRTSSSSAARPRALSAAPDVEICRTPLADLCADCDAVTLLPPLSPPEEGHVRHHCALDAPLAVFDLDDTLLDGDCTGMWMRWMVACGWIKDVDAFMAIGERHQVQYHAGTLDIHEHTGHLLSPLVGRHRDKVRREVDDFVEEMVMPRLLEGGIARLAEHGEAGHRTLIISASMHHLVGPIASRLTADGALATHPAFDEQGCFTGATSGIVTFREGKLAALDDWLAGAERIHRTPQSLWGYSDSHNDLPLLERVDFPHATQPDAPLRQLAEARGWPVVDWRLSRLSD
jgi:HAD superfamily hydrolase (TIGR01490 family)